VICRLCQDSGQLSTIRVVKTNSGHLQKIHFWDEQGEEHHHNPNVVRTWFRCSNGHQFEERSSWECCVCGFKACEAQVVYLEPGQSKEKSL
jgi:hypothetical protein